MIDDVLERTADVQTAHEKSRKASVRLPLPAADAVLISS